MTAETNTPTYWLNWRCLLCAIWILSCMLLASILIWKFECFQISRSKRRENREEAAGSLNEHEAWETCLKGIHPIWLLAYRLVAFVVLLVLLTADVIAKGGRIFYFYTQWTFTLVTIFFGVGTLFSSYGCCKQLNRNGNEADPMSLNVEQGTYVAPTLGEGTDASNKFKCPDSLENPEPRKSAGACGYIFQVLFQTCAGAVILTDTVYWLVLYRPGHLNFLIASMHSINAVFLLGETILNCLQFPLFRIAYFALWTCTYVIFQWIIHACVSMRWPYPFLDLSSPYAPLWYFGTGLMHIPCYGLFALVIKMKRSLLSRSFSEPYVR